jgi:hypothetical protein
VGGCFEKAWVVVKADELGINRNPDDPFSTIGSAVRGRPDRGYVNPQGLVAYPVTNQGNEEGSWRRYEKLRHPPRTSPKYDRSGEKHNISGFRNLSTPPFHNPGVDATRGMKTTDRAILSLEGTPAGRNEKGELHDKQTLGVTNAIPMLKPRMIIERAGQKKAFSGPRQRLAFGAGNAPTSVIQSLFSGDFERDIDEGKHDFDLRRNQYGDALLTDIEGNPLPSIMYDMYDLKDFSIANSKKRWAFENREMRRDRGQSWRDTFDVDVSGGVDALLRIPDPKNPHDYISHTDSSGYTFRGVPIPGNVARDEGKLGLEQAVLTPRGLGFRPEWMNKYGSEIYEAALEGKVVKMKKSGFSLSQHS